MIPVLTVVSDGQAWKRRDLIAAASTQAGMTPEQHEVVLNSGQPKIQNRIGWAISDLTTAAAIERPARATFSITQLGRDLMDSHPGGLTRADLEGIAAYRDYRPVPRRPTVAPAPEVAEEESDELSPEEQIESGIGRIHADVGERLIERLRGSDPAFFEEAVVKLLVAMGYGGAEQRGRRIGGTGDGGVDGVIDQDALGLEQIYVQAKRYAEGNSVGREAIQAFIGALHGFGASRGVFITTSTFTQNARNYADGIATRIVLIDGRRLVSLMMKYRVGVQVTQSYDVVDIDEDFFE
ncbi:restriction endonuclease [Zafaria sp. J156]|nr:restriction endonuclease [Zafaria sp. J156]